MKIHTLKLATIVFVLLLAACASSPQEELQAAEQALEEARQAEADVYASEQFQAAQKSLESARAEIQSQDQGFGLTRNYDNARELLETARANATEAAEMARTRKEEVREQAQTAQKEAQAEIEKAESALKRAPRRGEGARAQLQTLQADLDSAQASYKQGQQAFERQNYMPALEQFQSARNQAQTVLSYLQR